MLFLAHLKDKREHKLEEHLLRVAQLAEQFAGEKIGKQWAYLAGLWHDFGKYRRPFQCYLRGKVKKSNDTHHASTGALYAHQELGKYLGKILAYIIAGHHAGLPDYVCGNGRSLTEIFDEDKKFLTQALEQAPENIKKNSNSTPTLPEDVKKCEELHVWIRMVFSCLVDADYLDTEEFMNKEQSHKRETSVKMEEMSECFTGYMERLTDKTTCINCMRSKILEQCQASGHKPPGVFTLTVPTGGGKTLSSLGFALEHAIKHKKSRIIYAIPYTSIIEQTADTFRKVFARLKDENIILEHHSNMDPDKKEEERPGSVEHWVRLAAENWDAPLIITTTVQLFESLYAARPSRCRKLHNLVDSIIVLDEWQLLPLEHQNPIRHIIRVLQESYGVTFLLSTATPLNFDKHTDFLGREKLEKILTKEILQAPEEYYEKLSRVRYHFPNQKELCKESSWEDICPRILEHESGLCVVHKRKEALELFQLVSCKRPTEEVYHLSTLMCAQHRSEVIETIRQRLERREPTWVISTNLIEAGVDLDFPVVFRALAGLDSIVQAAGRCNREGKLEKGDVYVFPSEPPKGRLKDGKNVMISLCSREDFDINNLETPELCQQYFECLFRRSNRKEDAFDTSKMEEKLQRDAAQGTFQFRTAGKDFQFIEDKTTSVFVPYNKEAEKALYALKHQVREEKPLGFILRRLQRYTVGLYPKELLKLKAIKMVEEIGDNLYYKVLKGVYKDKTGITWELSVEDTVL